MIDIDEDEEVEVPDILGELVKDEKSYKMEKRRLKLMKAGNEIKKAEINMKRVLADIKMKEEMTAFFQVIFDKF